MKTETECREFIVPFYKTEEELLTFLRSLDELNHDYGTAAYAMSLAGTAAFNYIASKFGTTGFQASLAVLDMIGRIKCINGPFIILKADDAMYPQYDLHAQLDEFLAEARPWMKEKAKSNLNKDMSVVHPNVWEYWTALSEGGEQHAQED